MIAPSVMMRQMPTVIVSVLCFIVSPVCAVDDGDCNTTIGGTKLWWGIFGIRFRDCGDDVACSDADADD